MTMSDNSAQIEFWNSEPAQNWVACQADLDQIHAGVVDLLLAAADPQPGERVVDIGCGAGASTFAVADRVAPGGAVQGIDVSAPLLARAIERSRERGSDTVTFTEADAQVHAFEPAAFDLAVSRFGVMFFANPVAAFSNIASALRPGGRLAFVSWAGPEHNPLFTAPQRAAVARLGEVEPVPPDAPGPMAFRDTDRTLGLLAAAGFRGASVSPNDIDLHHPGGLDALLRLIGQVGPIGRMMREKNGTAEDRAAIQASLRSEFERYETDDGIRLPARVNVFTARAG